MPRVSLEASVGVSLAGGGSFIISVTDETLASFPEMKSFVIMSIVPHKYPIREDCLNRRG